jgi:hypothetical protein
VRRGDPALRGRAVLTGENLTHLSAIQPVKPASRRRRLPEETGKSVSEPPTARVRLKCAPCFPIEGLMPPVSAGGRITLCRHRAHWFSLSTTIARS